MFWWLRKNFWNLRLKPEYRPKIFLLKVRKKERVSKLFLEVSQISQIRTIIIDIEKKNSWVRFRYLEEKLEDSDFYAFAFASSQDISLLQTVMHISFVGGWNTILYAMKGYFISWMKSDYNYLLQFIKKKFVIFETFTIYQFLIRSQYVLLNNRKETAEKNIITEDFQMFP